MTTLLTYNEELQDMLGIKTTRPNIHIKPKNLFKDSRTGKIHVIRKNVYYLYVTDDGRLKLLKTT